jgi:hypothetical protein
MKRWIILGSALLALLLAFFFLGTLFSLLDSRRRSLAAGKGSSIFSPENPG